MIRRPEVDTKLIERFLQKQHFRHAATAKNYAGTLRNFSDFIATQGIRPSLTVSTVRKWLKERSMKWPEHILCHRTFLVERYLEWLLDQGVITSNPFAELHRHYGPRTSPIVRALIGEHSDAALEKIRRLPRFGSWLGSVMEDHVAHMRGLGYRIDNNERTLLRFDRFLQERPELYGLSLNTLAEHWSKVQPSPYHLYEARRAGRIVSKAMHRLDPRVPVLPIGDGIARAARQHHRSAHLYTDEEIQMILNTALSYPSPKSPLRPIVLFTMLVLAYCVGLRGREIVGLRLEDVDLREETITIRETKFFKHRRLPLPPGVMAALKRYLSLREIDGAPTSPGSALFWSSQRSRGYCIGGVRIVLTDVLRRAGVKPARGQVGARIHDLRHSMVSHRMRDWYQAGINPQSRLPYLATYLGHSDIRSTLVYLHITPELLQEAGERFRKSGAAALLAAEEMQ